MSAATQKSILALAKEVDCNYKDASLRITRNQSGQVVVMIKSKDLWWFVASEADDKRKPDPGVKLEEVSDLLEGLIAPKASVSPVEIAEPPLA